MPTSNPRVNITLKPHQHELLGRLAKHQRTSRAALVRELFEQVYPVLERIAVLADAAAEASQGVKDRLGSAADQAERDMLPLVEKSLSQLDMFIATATKDLKRIGGGGRAQRGRPARATGGPPPSNHGGQVRTRRAPPRRRKGSR